MSYDTDTAFLRPPDGDFIGSFIRLSRFEIDFESQLVTFDQNFGPLIDYPSIGILKESEFLDMMHPGDQEHYIMFMKPIKEGLASTIKKDMQLKTADGTWRWFEFSARLKKSHVPSGARVLEGIIIDISDRRQAMADPNEYVRWFRQVLEESPHAMYRVDYRKNRFDYVSKGFADALNCTREEILGMAYTEFMTGIHPDDLRRMRPELDQQFAKANGKQFTYYSEFRFKLKDGNYVWLDDTFTVVPGEDGQYSYQVGFGSKIEDRKYLEEQLRLANEQLEEKVSQRTVELKKANERLEDLLIERRGLEKKLLEISERERRFVGRELHDGLCQQIVGVQCMFEALRHRLSSYAAVETEELKMIRDFMHDAVLQMRNLSRGLCPLSLAPGAVGAALATLAAQTSVLYKIGCNYNGPADASVNNPDAALHVYRITQEAIQNAIRHGLARNIEIQLSKIDDQLHMQIDNDGRPLDAQPVANEEGKTREPGSGLGLKLIDYRVGLLGGRWHIANHEGRVRLTVNAPVHGGALQ